MACGSCGARKAGATSQYEVTLPDGTKRTASSLTQARMIVATAGGGTYRLKAAQKSA